MSALVKGVKQKKRSTRSNSMYHQALLFTQTLFGDSVLRQGLQIVEAGET